MCVFCALLNCDAKQDKMNSLSSELDLISYSYYRAVALALAPSGKMISLRVTPSLAP